MKIEPDEEAAARQWLASRGETTEGLSLHAWVSSLDAGTRKALSQYLRLRRHRRHAPKVALEITTPVHLALSEYASKVDGISLGEAIGQLLSAPRADAAQAPATGELEALRATLAEREKELRDLRRRAKVDRPASESPQPKRKGSPALDTPPACPACGGPMQLWQCDGGRWWVCLTREPRSCPGMIRLDAEVPLSTQAIRADLGARWACHSGVEVAKAASMAKRTVTGLAQTVAQYAQYWSVEEAASFSGAQDALDKLTLALELAGRKRKVDEKTEAERFAERSEEARRMLEGRLRPESRRERIWAGYALSSYSGTKNRFTDGLRWEMAEVERLGLGQGARNSVKAIDAAIRDALDDDTRDSVWRTATGHQPVAELVAQWEADFARRLDVTRTAGAVLADEVEAWLEKRAAIEAEQLGRVPGSTGGEA